VSRIIYGVSGEGSGHTSRAREIIRHLQSQGHEVRAATYDRSYTALRSEFDCLEIEGLHIVSIDNRVKILRTLQHNLRRAPRAIKYNKRLIKLFDDFSPDCVITDFEPSTAWMAMLRRIPLISLDNQHRMRYMKFRVPVSLSFQKWLTRMIIALMIPRPDIALATSLVVGESTSKKAAIFPPIVRQEVLELTPAEKDYHLVYVTSAFETLIHTLKSFPDKTFVVYGHGRSDTEQNIRFREFSSDGFLRDLAGCKSVIATAGFTLISEAMYLEKPYLALPMQGQFEQQLNAIILDESGCGINARTASIRYFHQFFDRYAELKHLLNAHNSQLRQMGFEHYGASAIKLTLDHLLKDDLLLLKQVRQGRRLDIPEGNQVISVL